MAADFCFVIAAFDNPENKVAWIPDREADGGEGSSASFNAQTWCFLIF